jgi:hypothetical protein
VLTFCFEIRVPIPKMMKNIHLQVFPAGLAAHSGGLVNHVKVSVIGLRVLAGDAIEPKEGSRNTFENVADFISQGMFDFQPVTNINITSWIKRYPDYLITGKYTC